MPERRHVAPQDWAEMPETEEERKAMQVAWLRYLAEVPDFCDED